MNNTDSINCANDSKKRLHDENGLSDVKSPSKRAKIDKSHKKENTQKDNSPIKCWLKFVNTLTNNENSELRLPVMQFGDDNKNNSTLDINSSEIDIINDSQEKKNHVSESDFQLTLMNTLIDNENSELKLPVMQCDVDNKNNSVLDVESSNIDTTNDSGCSLNKLVTKGSLKSYPKEFSPTSKSDKQNPFHHNPLEKNGKVILNQLESALVSNDTLNRLDSISAIKATKDSCYKIYRKKHNITKIDNEADNLNPYAGFKYKYIDNICIYCNKKCENPKDDLVELNSTTLMGTYTISNEYDILNLNKGNSKNNSFELFNFKIYDPNGHMCPLIKFDTEGSVLLISGTVACKGLRFVDFIGPIIKWDVISNNILAIFTKQIEFIASYPDKKYQKYFEESIEKITIRSHFLNYFKNLKVSVSLERMKLDVIKYSKNEITMEKINANLKFIITEIYNWVKNLDYSERLNVERFECIRLINEVMNETNVQLKTFTPLVKDMLSLIEFRRLKKNAIELCGVCDNCKKRVCKYCKTCKYNPSKSRICDKIRCLNIQNTDGIKLNHQNFPPAKYIIKNVHSHDEKIYFTEITIGSIHLKQHDFVQIKIPSCENHSIYQIMFMWGRKNKEIYYIHGREFIKGSDTILGCYSNTKEIFSTNKCNGEISFDLIFSKINVQKMSYKNFATRSSLDDNQNFIMKNVNFYYSKLYNVDDGSFIDVPDLPLAESDNYKTCRSCEDSNEKLSTEIPKVTYEKNNGPKNHKIVSVEWKNQKYNIGDAVFYNSNDLFDKDESEDEDEAEKNNEIYKEYYRKPSINKKKNVMPYSVGIISSINFVESNYSVPDNINLIINMLYRPENTDLPNASNDDLNCLYWVNTEKIINLSQIIEPAVLAYKFNIPEKFSIQDWSEHLPNRFYIKGSYDTTNKKIIPDSPKVKEIGIQNKYIDNAVQTLCHEMKMKKLKGFEIFGGCGGFSSGLNSSNAVEIKWTIEYDKDIARSYQINHPECCVIKDEANAFLSKVINDANRNSHLPKRGDVEFLICSPPCQGFSILNRFKDTGYSNSLNSLIYTCLSYVDYYRPKYFLLENVRNLATFDNGSITQVMIRTLLECGYQCRIGVLQAGNFGVPQNRRRFFIWAAAPGLKLPQFPKPTHCFEHPTSLNITINDKCIGPCEQYFSAPRRMCTINDAISDLPIVNKSLANIHTEYSYKQLTEYQRKMKRNKTQMLLDHDSKPLSLLNKKRVMMIPRTANADWRDLPNITLTLPDGKSVTTLKYDYEDENGIRRGVCPCISKKPCTVKPPKMTLIPFFLAHTADKNNHWEGVLGRLDMNGYFKTTLTNPNPLGKQGRVIHPKENRIVSVRECARSQGFPDDFVFTGELKSRYKQVGNAVPPPLALAIGKELALVL